MTLTNIQPMARLILSAGIIFGVLAAVAATSSALFSDSASIQNSTFSTGTVDLMIAADNTGVPGPYDSTIGGASITGMLPGDTQTFPFWLRNASSGTVELDVSALINDVVGNTDVQANLLVGFTCDVGNDDETTPDSTIAPKSLDQWEIDGNTIGLGTLVAGGTANGTGTDEADCVMTATLDNDASAEEATVTFDAEFTGATEEET